MLAWHLDKLRLRLRSLFRSASADRDLTRELRAHLAQETEANIAAGMNPDEARRAALRAFGSVAAVEEHCRDTRRVAFVDHLVRDLRYAVRTVLRQRGLSTAAAISIALGLGANVTIFSLGSSSLLSVPSAERPAELVHIRTSNGSHVSYRGWQHLDASGVLAGVAGYQFEQGVNWRDGEESIALLPLLVTANFFDVVRPPMHLGRGFSATEGRAEIDPHLVVVSHGLWTRRLQSDPQVVGRSLTINGEPYTVTGVLAPGLRGIAGFGLAPDMYLPLSRRLLPRIDGPREAVAQLVGRLKPDQTVEQGRAAIDVVIGDLVRTQSEPEFRSLTVFAPVGGLSQIEELQELGVFFLVLLVVSALVLAIACANVAGLLLARGLSRGREIAMRLALGASRGRIIQQLMIESAVLTILGTLLAFLLTMVALGALSRVALPVPMPIDVQPALDWRLTMFAAALIVLSTCVTGLMPALHTTRAALLPAIRLDDRPFPGRRLILRSVLVAGQVAVSVVLLVAALGFVRSFVRAGVLHPGFDVDRVLVARVAFVEGRQGTAGRFGIEEIADRVRSVPGVSAVSFSNGVPLTVFGGYTTGTDARFDGIGKMPVEYNGNPVGPGYFEAMGIRLIRGRDFTEADRRGSPPVVIVNEEFVRRYLPGVDPIGRHMSLSRTGGLEIEIVGVVSNGRYRSFAESRNAALYEPALGLQPRRMVHVLARTEADPAALTSAVRQAVLSADPTAAISLMTLREAVSFAVLPSRMGSILLGLLGVLGTVLAMTGLFGVVAFAVGRRTAEIAIRMTLGASHRAVLWLVATDAARLVLPGIAAGVLLAWFVTPPLSAFLVAGVNPGDPLMLTAAATLMVLASLVAIWGPALRALRIAPTRALKSE